MAKHHNNTIKALIAEFERQTSDLEVHNKVLFLKEQHVMLQRIFQKVSFDMDEVIKTQRLLLQDISQFENTNERLSKLPLLSLYDVEEQKIKEKWRNAKIQLDENAKALKHIEHTSNDRYYQWYKIFKVTLITTESWQKWKARNVTNFI